VVQNWQPPKKVGQMEEKGSMSEGEEGNLYVIYALGHRAPIIDRKQRPKKKD